MKLNLVIPKKIVIFGHFGPFLAYFWSILGEIGHRDLIDCAKHSQPIRATRGALESLLGRLQKDTTMVGNGRECSEIQAGEVEFGHSKKIVIFGHFGPF